MGLIFPDFRPVAQTTSEIQSSCDVLVAGGGPAGATIAAFLARKGWSVQLLEKDEHPRFHIGESLLPMGMPILERLGVIAEAEALGVKKLGADFPASNDRGYNVFYFERALNCAYPYALQVRRQDFDRMLFNNAARSGARALTGCKVQQVTFSGEHVQAKVLDASARHHEVQARYFVDASGRDTLLGDRLKLKQKSRRHQSAALFAHFKGAVRRPGDDAGNISIYRFHSGWVWMIPLPDDVMSVGAVCYPEYLKQKKGRGTEFLLETLRAIPDCWARLQNAEVIGNQHATGNYSYSCNRFGGPRWLAVGDACAFVDPIFSSGVFLAMNSAELGAELVDRALREPHQEARLQAEYTRTVRQGVKEFSWFIERFTTPAMRHLFANPRNVFQLEQALISMLAGDVFRDGGVRIRLKLFKAIYYMHCIGMAAEQWRNFRQRRQQVREQFAGGTTSQDYV